MILGRRRSIAGAAIAVACTLLTAAAFGVVVPSAGAAGAPYKVNSWTDPAGDLHRVRWDPCQTVTYAVNVQLAARTNRARARAVGDVQRAFRRAARETGLHFSYSGRTREVPRNTSQSWSARQQAAEIVVAWVNPARPKFRSDLLSNDGSGYPSGVGGWMLRGWLGPNGHWQAAVGRGFVVINAQQNHVYKAGYGA
ncbi:MAG TPA: hypothetical protein VMT27_04505, partial [Actinomycetes bacterium]|nr:hypothetical protein [Actinomycetes bacterium]